MSLTLVYRNKRVRLAFSLGRRHLLAGAAAGVLCVWLSNHLITDNDDALERVRYTQTGLEQQRAEVVAVKRQTEERLTGMLIKLGEMQGQLLRLNALGQTLVEQADLDAQEFGFDELPSIGGPSAQSTEEALILNRDVLADMDSLLASIDAKSQQLEALESILMNHHVERQSHLSGRPIKSGWLSSYYGIRKDPFNGLPAMHKGLDFAGKEGAPVVSTGAGLVTWAGERYGYGNLIEIDHGNGIVSRYGHNREITVSVGDVVTKGQQIGLMGKTGRATGAHVHYEVLRNGKQIDPLPFVSRKS